MSEHLIQMQRQIDQLARELERLKTVEKFPTIPNTTWTPALSFGGASVGMTYTAQNGRYVNVGKAVLVTGYIVLSAKGSSTGNAAVTLPLAGGTLYQGYLNCFWSLPTSYVHVGIRSAFGSASGDIFGATAAATAPTQLTDANFNNTSQLRFSGVYFIA